MKIILYSTPTCPKCKMIEMKLEAKGYEVIREMDPAILDEFGFQSVPWLSVDGNLYDFMQANQFVNSLPEVTK